MKRAMLFPAFLLGLSCSIHASHRPYPARVSYPRTSPAYELERATASLRHDAELAFRGRSRYENKALKEIRRLHDRAQDFRRSVERRYGDEWRSRNDFDRLMRQYYRAEDALRYAYVPRRIYLSLNDVRRVMSRMQQGYAYYR